MAKQGESLFLLEVLVDKVIFMQSPCITDKDFRTCIILKFANLEVIELCDNETPVNSFVKYYNSGKSCLFSMKENEINQAINNCPVKLIIEKSMPCGCLPTRVVMGEVSIDLTKEFAQARSKYLEDPTNLSYEAIKDSFKIAGADGTQVGEIFMLLRITCFGKNIVSKFQAYPNVMGGKGTVLDHSCKQKRPNQTPGDPCGCGNKHSLGISCNDTLCPIPQDPFNSMPCRYNNEVCPCTKGQNIQNNLPRFKDCCPPGNKVIFQMPTDGCSAGHRQRAHFNLDSNGVGDISRDEPGQLRSTNAEDYPGVVYDFPSQIIKMRIGKTIEMPGRKSKFEYQFITPAVNQEKVIPLTDYRTAQCVPKCNCCKCRNLCCH